MQIRIIKPGVFSTIQDLGRSLHLAEAVPVSGTMDTLSARIANMAVGNDGHAAVIEFTYADAEFIAETNLLIAWAGDGAILNADTETILAERPVYIPQGTVIKLAANATGSRTYLAVAGGWDVPEVLGSRSTYIIAGFGGLAGRILEAGDVLSSISELTPTTRHIVNSLQQNSIEYPHWSIARHLFLPENRNVIRIVPANEFTWFNGISILNFLGSPYKLSLNSNRMGYNLEGTAVNRSVKKELLSTAVIPGTIQVTGSGSLVLLMADCQTTGGYPRIAQVAAVDLPLCGQLNPGNTIYFQEISRHEAEMLYLEREQELHQLTTAIRNKYL